MSIHSPGFRASVVKLSSRGSAGFRMLAQIVLRSYRVARGRMLAALLALTVAATVAAAILNLSPDVGGKLESEFRAFGANIVVMGHEGRQLPPDTISQVDKLLAGRGTAAPFAYAVARTARGSAVVVVGADLERTRTLNPWWSVTGWPKHPGEALIGTRAAAALGKEPVMELKYGRKNIQVRPVGILSTGGAEDDRVYLALADFEPWTLVRPNTIEIASAGRTPEVLSAIGRLQAALPQADVLPVRRMVEAEARVLDKITVILWACAAFIALTVALCVMATFMSSLLERRKDFAVMAALGASRAALSSIFAVEAAALGMVAALLGFLMGFGLASWIGRVNFHAVVGLRWAVFPQVLGGTIALGVLSSLLPSILLRQVQPAAILKGE